MQQQFSRVPLSVMNLAEMMNFAVISDALKCLKGIFQPEISPVSNMLEWVGVFSTHLFKKKKRPCHRSEVEMMRRFKSVRSDCASGVKWNMEQLIQGVEVLMCSSGQNFIALHNSKANNKGGGWMFLLVAAVCLFAGTCRNTKQLKQATTRGCLLLFFGCPPLLCVMFTS